MNQNNDGFKFVSYKRKKKTRVSADKNLGLKCVPDQNTSLHSYDIDESKLKILQEDIEKSRFFETFKEIIRQIVNKQKNFKTESWNLENKLDALFISESEKSVDLICYGLGSFSSCVIARHQLAFLMVLRNNLNPISAKIYDPVFSISEKTCLTKLGFDVLKVDEKAKKSVISKTIFFMPHCDLPLYNNLLWSNWNVNAISNLIIIGNSFSNYERLTSSEFDKSGYFVKKAIRFVSEVKMPDYKFNDIFNDMSIHYFKKNTLCEVVPSTWLKTKEPVYE